ncbi:MAG: hypothetical protein WC782_06020 [Methylococcaceae bacterium]|jgi:hypothetical protein
MQKHDSTPMWVFLAFSSIETRKSAIILIICSLIFTLYCIPWSQFFTELAWVPKVFLIDDWSWAAMMVPVLIWYWLSLRWVDKKQGWENKA